MANKTETPPEEIEEFLNRLDISDENYESEEIFGRAVDGIFLDTLGFGATGSQKSALYNVGNVVQRDFPNFAIQKITYQIRNKEVTRYVLPFQRGLFGFQKALELFKSLK